MYKKLAIIAFILALAGYFLLSSYSSDKITNRLVVFTQVPADQPLSGKNFDDLPTYDQSGIVSLDLDDEDRKIHPLTEDFYAACSPSFSIDHKQIVFSARKTGQDNWQIWIMDTDGSGQEQVIETEEDCLSPSFLPDGKIVFSQRWGDPDLGSGYYLFTCQADGSELHQITFHPHKDLYPSVLHDGRISMGSQQIYPKEENADLMVLRPDGTKCQSLYHRPDSMSFRGRLAEGPDKQLYFIESNGENDFLTGIRYAHPVNSQKEILRRPLRHLHSLDLLDSSQFVISALLPGKEVFGLYALDETGTEKLIFLDEDMHSIEPISVRKRLTPKILPSTVSMEKGVATLIGQDAGYSQIKIDGDPETKYIRVLGLNRVMQEFPVEEDGSFYLKVQSDTPVRFESLDSKGEILRGPSNWIWLRANERRACTGCHAKKEVAPKNLVPEAINKDPHWVSDTSFVKKGGNIVWHKKAEVKNDY